MNKTEEMIRGLSDEAFQNHQITELMRSGVYRSWRCCRPEGGSVYQFDITTIPGHLIITGDLGSLVVSREWDMLPWCRGSVDSTDYFGSKVVSDEKRRVFSHEALKEWLDEQLADPELPDDHREIIDDVLDEGIENDGSDYFYRVLLDIWEGNDSPDWTDWHCQFLWKRDAIRWFVMHHDEPEIKFERRTKN